MRKLLCFFIMTPIALFAQGNENQKLQVDSAQNVTVMISVEKLTALENSRADLDKELKAANKKILELQETIQKDSVTIRKNSDCISRLKTDSLSLHNTEKKLKEQLLISDKCLINMASNFLYIPYESFSIDSIAIRSFESVSDNALRERHRIRYTLLKNYQRDLVAIVSFLKTQQEELRRNPFNNDANEAISVLHKELFYISYHQYDDWQSTFLGNKIAIIENRLKSFKKNTKLDFNDIIISLENCLKTE